MIYEVNPNKGDGQLIIYNTRDRSRIKVPRGKRAYFDEESKILVCLVSPAESKLDSLRRVKLSEEKLPSDTLVLLNLQNRHKTSLPHVSSYHAPSKWYGWIFYQKEPGRDTMFENSLPRKLSEDETILMVHNLRQNKTDTIFFVEDIILSEETPVIFIQNNAPDSLGQASIIRRDLITNQFQTVYTAKGKLESLCSSKDGQALAFLVDTNSVSSPPSKYMQCIWTMGDPSGSEIISTDDLPDNWIFSSEFESHFSPDGRRFFFGIKPEPIRKDTSLLPSEIVDVEIWTYRDQVLYTQQKVQVDKERSRSYLSLYDVESKSFEPIASPSLPTVLVHPEVSLDYAIGLDDQNNRMPLSWEGRYYQDLYLISP